MPSSEPIFLTGMMGSGKSSLGRKLASLLRWQFIDLDEQVEKRAGLTVSEIFDKLGEQAFRTFESEALLGLADSTDCVIALGGGTLMNTNNLSIVLRSGTLAYLQMSEEAIIARLREINSADRPLLDQKFSEYAETTEQNKSCGALLRAREPGYSAAHVVVAVADLTPIESLEALKSALPGYEFEK